MNFVSFRDFCFSFIELKNELIQCVFTANEKDAWNYMNKKRTCLPVKYTESAKERNTSFGGLPINVESINIKDSDEEDDVDEEDSESGSGNVSELDFDSDSDDTIASGYIASGNTIADNIAVTAAAQSDDGNNFESPDSIIAEESVVEETSEEPQIYLPTILNGIQTDTAAANGHRTMVVAATEGVPECVVQEEPRTNLPNTSNSNTSIQINTDTANVARSVDAAAKKDVPTTSTMMSMSEFQIKIEKPLRRAIAKLNERLGDEIISDSDSDTHSEPSEADEEECFSDEEDGNKQFDNQFAPRYGYVTNV